MEKHFPKLFEKVIKSNHDLYEYVLISRTEHGNLDTAFFNQPVLQRPYTVLTQPVTVFANYGSASASVDFVHRMSQLPQVQVIGTPVLGPHTGTWGNANMTSLEKTGLGIAVPTIRYNYDNSFIYDRMPIRPDVEIKNNPMDWIEHKDTVLEYFLSH
jgi:C-terminal processing protease CtpA/Prc